MKFPQHTKPIYSCFLFLCWLLFAAPLHGAPFEEEVSTQEYLFVKGIIRAVSPEEGTLTLKQKKGPKISLSVDKDTVLEGFHQLTELKRRQKIKVWYQPKKENKKNNRAAKILKPLELGC